MSANPIDKRIGARLRRVRESLGLTLQTASEIVGFNTYQTLGSIEKGTRPAKASELAKLCDHYCKDSWFFLREDEPEELPPICAWRNSRDTGNQPLVKAQVYDVARNYQLLEEVTGENQTSTLVPWAADVELTWESVADKANELVTEWNLGARPAKCLHEILEGKLYIKIVNFDLQDAGSALTAEGEFGYIIALNATEVSWRRSFSLAHELFHLLSKHIFPLNRIHLDTNSELGEKPREEKLADTFAASLLMPANGVVTELEKRLSDTNEIEWVDLVGIAMEFGVSTEAMLWRLKRLGRLTSDQVNQLLTSATFRGIDQSSRTGRRDAGLPYSRRMVWLGLKALKLGKISKGKFCQIFKIARGRFDSFISDYGDLVYDENNADALDDPIELISPDNNNEGRAMA